MRAPFFAGGCISVFLLLLGWLDVHAVIIFVVFMGLGVWGLNMRWFIVAGYGGCISVFLLLGWVLGWLDVFPDVFFLVFFPLLLGVWRYVLDSLNVRDSPPRAWFFVFLLLLGVWLKVSDLILFLLGLGVWLRAWSNTRCPRLVWLDLRDVNQEGAIRRLRGLVHLLYLLLLVWLNVRGNDGVMTPGREFLGYGFIIVLVLLTVSLSMRDTN